jgi:hypothetical protein
VKTRPVRTTQFRDSYPDSLKERMHLIGQNRRPAALVVCSVEVSRAKVRISTFSEESRSRVSSQSPCLLYAPRVVDRLESVAVNHCPGGT